MLVASIYCERILWLLKLVVNKVLKDGADLVGGRTNSHRKHNSYPLLSIANFLS